MEAALAIEIEYPVQVWTTELVFERIEEAVVTVSQRRKKYSKKKIQNF